jgi:glutamine synthetase
MARTTIYPAAIRYQGELAATGANLKAVGYPFDTATLDKVSDLAGGLLQSVERLEEALAHESDDLGEEAHHMCSKVIPEMNAVREYADGLEEVVADDLWPLPTYQEILFIK